jgi:hypothetical protein
VARPGRLHKSPLSTVDGERKGQGP